MSSAFAVGKRSITWSVVVATIAWSMGLSLLVAPLAARAALPATGSLIKGSLPAIYYYGTDSKRYVFPNEKTYKTWYADFSSVTTVTDAELASVSIGGNATYRPGVKMVKITTDPKVYAVGAGGTLRHVATEAVASALYGAGWAGMVEDVPDAFFVNYTIGAAVNAAADWSPAAATAAATNIGVDKGLGGAAAAPAVPAGPAVLTAMDGGSPGNATIPYNATDVIMAKVKFAGTGTISSIRATRTGLARDADITGLKLFDGTTQLGTTQTLNSAHQAAFTGLNLAVSGEKTLTIAADVSNVNAGDILQFGLEAGSDVTLASGSVGGTFPLRGGQMTISSVAIGAATLFRGPDMPTSDTEVRPDEVDYRFTQVRIQAGSAEDLTVRQIMAIQSGTATSSDIKDIKLVNDSAGTTLATIATLPANGRVVFDNLSVPIKKGEDVKLSVKASLTGGSSSGRTVGFDFHDGVAYTVRVVGNTFGFGVTPTRNDFCATTGVAGGVCQRQTVSSGTLRVSRASSSPPTGNVAQGGTQVPLVAVEYTVTGEEVRVTSQNWDFTLATLTCAQLTSVTLYNAAGSVVAGPQDCANNTITFTDSMSIPVGTTTYTMKGNIAQAATGGGTVAAVLDVSEYTVRGVQSGKTTTVNTTTDITGNTQTVQAAALRATTGATPIAGSLVAGVQDFTFTNIILDASSGGEDAKVSSLIVTDATGTSALPNDLVNWELWGDLDTSDSNDAVARLETSNSTAAATATANTAGIDSTVTFTLKTPLRISKNKSSTLQVKADLIAGATTGTTTAFAHQVNLNAAADITSTGWITGTAIAETVAGAGQTQIIRASGTLKVELAADTATAGPIVAGSAGVSLAKYKLTSAFEDVTVRDIPLYLANGAVAAGTLGNVSQVKVYKDGTLVGNTAGYQFGSNATVTAANLDMRVVKDVPLYIELKADFTPKEQAASGTQARAGIGDSDGDASTWGTTRAGAAGNYNIVATGRDSGTTITAASITSTGAAGGVVAGGDAFGVFDGVLTVGLDANSPSGTQTAGTGREAFRFWVTATGDEIRVYDLGFLVSGSASGGDGSGQISGTGDAVLFSTDRATRYADWATADVTQPLDPGANGLHVQSADAVAAGSDAGADGTTGWDTILSVGAGQTKVLILTGDTTGAGGASTSKSLQVRLDDEAATAAGVQWMDVELDGLAGTCTAAAATVDAGAECVVDSGTFTKTLPVNGNGLTYN